MWSFPRNTSSISSFAPSSSPRPSISSARMLISMAWTRSVGPHGRRSLRSEKISRHGVSPWANCPRCHRRHNNSMFLNAWMSGTIKYATGALSSSAASSSSSTSSRPGTRLTTAANDAIDPRTSKTRSRSGARAVGSARSWRPVGSRARTSASRLNFGAKAAVWRSRGNGSGLGMDLCFPVGRSP